MYNNTKQLRILGIVFSLLFILQAGFILYGLATSTYGWEIEYIVTVVVFILIVLSFGIIYFLSRKKSWNSVILFIVGTVLVAYYEAFFPLSPIGALWKQRATNLIQVSNLKESVLLSRQGNPIGIQINYDIEFPVSGAFDVDLKMYAHNKKFQHYDLEMSASTTNQTIVPRAFYGWINYKKYKSGIVYRVKEGATPVYLFSESHDHGKIKKGEICIRELNSKTLSMDDLLRRVQSDMSTRYTLVINAKSNNVYVTPRTVFQHETTEYKHNTYYKSNVKEGGKICN